MGPKQKTKFDPCQSDRGMLRPPHGQLVGGTKLEDFAGSQFRMNEFMSGVLCCYRGCASGMRSFDPCAAMPNAFTLVWYARARLGESPSAGTARPER